MFAHLASHGCDTQVLEDFSTARPSLAHLLDYIPLLQVTRLWYNFLAHYAFFGSQDHSQ